MNHKKFAQKIYSKFSKVDGNEYIAGDYALEKILGLVKSYKPKNILEVGLGIGSIADSILNYTELINHDVSYSGTEKNEFCLSALKVNVDKYSSIKLYNEISEINAEESFSFAIIDGSDSRLEDAKHLLSKRAVLFVEGHRISQVNTLKEIFPNSKHVEIISARKPPNHGPFSQKWTGGGQLIFINPTAKQNLNFATEKAKTFLKRRLRKFIKNA